MRDPDSTRRRQAVEAARKTLAARSGFDTGSFERGDIAAVWGIWHEAPRDFASTEQWDVLLIGEPFRAPVPGRCPRQPYGVERGQAEQGPPPHDGYHLALKVAARRAELAGDPPGRRGRSGGRVRMVRPRHLRPAGATGGTGDGDA